MLALYRSGRQAEALAAYQEARRALADELGIEPSPALRELERMILQQDAGLELAASPSALPVPAAAPEPSGDAAPEEMLKLVTVLVADAGSAAPAQARHPEDVRELMTDYVAAMSGEICAEGATAESFVGDAIMAVFGVPTVHEDDAVRAVRAACRMVERLERWNEARPGGRSRAPHRPEHGRGPRLERPRRGSPYRRRRGHPRRTAPAGRRARRDRGRRAHRPAVRPHFELRALEGPVSAWLVEGAREERSRRPSRRRSSAATTSSRPF